MKQATSSAHTGLSWLSRIGKLQSSCINSLDSQWACFSYYYFGTLIRSCCICCSTNVLPWCDIIVHAEVGSCSRSKLVCPFLCMSATGHLWCPCSTASNYCLDLFTLPRYIYMLKNKQHRWTIHGLFTQSDVPSKKHLSNAIQKGISPDNWWHEVGSFFDCIFALLDCFALLCPLLVCCLKHLEPESRPRLLLYLLAVCLSICWRFRSGLHVCLLASITYENMYVVYIYVYNFVVCEYTRFDVLMCATVTVWHHVVVPGSTMFFRLHIGHTVSSLFWKVAHVGQMHVNKWNWPFPILICL